MNFGGFAGYDVMEFWLGVVAGVILLFMFGTILLLWLFGFGGDRHK